VNQQQPIFPTPWGTCRHSGYRCESLKRAYGEWRCLFIGITLKEDPRQNPVASAECVRRCQIVDEAALRAIDAKAVKVASGSE
jgi:hypothetical protein